MHCIPHTHAHARWRDRASNREPFDYTDAGHAASLSRTHTHTQTHTTYTQY